MMIMKGHSVSSGRAAHSSSAIQAPLSIRSTATQRHLQYPSSVVNPAPASGVAAKATKGFGTPKPPKKVEVKKKPAGPPDELCPCESDKTYTKCCQPAHEGTKPAQTLKEAIRARFSAYRMGNKPYILSTFHPTYANFHYEKPMEEVTQQLEDDVTFACENYEYYNLIVQKTEMGVTGEEGEIAFSYKSGPRGSPPEKFETTNEKNRFIREDGVWKFADYQRFQYNSSALFQDVENVSVEPAAAKKQE